MAIRMVSGRIEETLPEEVGVLHGPLAEAPPDREYLECIGIHPEWDAEGALRYFPENRRELVNMPPFSIEEGVFVHIGGVAVSSQTLWYAIHVVYDCRVRNEDVCSGKMDLEEKVMRSLGAREVFRHRKGVYDVVLTALFPWSTLPGTQTPRGLKQTIKNRMMKARERAGRIQKIHAGKESVNG